MNKYVHMFKNSSHQHRKMNEKKTLNLKKNDKFVFWFKTKNKTFQILLVVDQWKSICTHSQVKKYSVYKNYCLYFCATKTTTRTTVYIIVNAFVSEIDFIYNI